MTVEMAEVDILTPDDDVPANLHDPLSLDDTIHYESKFDNDGYRTAPSSRASSEFFDSSSFQNLTEYCDNEKPCTNEVNVLPDSNKTSIELPEGSQTPIVENNERSPKNDPAVSTNLHEETPEYSERTKQFLDLLDLATGKKPLSGYSILKDRIGTLMRNASRQKYAGGQGPRWTGLGVVNIVNTVETRSKKSTDSELTHRTRFVPQKGVVSDEQATKHAGQWKGEVAKDQYANIPEPNFDEKLRAHMNSIFGSPLRLNWKKGRESESSESSGKRRKLDMGARITVRTLCDDYDDEMNPPENEDRSESNDRPPSKITFISLGEKERDETEPFEMNGVNFDEDAEVSFSVTSINDYLASQLDDALNPEGTNIYFIEEECIMLSPYSNEAKLYRLLFPGKRIPIKEGEEPKNSEQSNIIECSQQEDKLPVLSSQYTDDMWVSESDEEPTPEPVKEPTPEPPPKEPTPEPPPKPKKEKRKKPEVKKKIYDRSLVKAVQMNQSDVVEQILWDGADPNTSSSIGTVLHQAAQLGFTYTLQILLWGCADTERRNELGDTPLHLAAIAGHNDIVFELSANGCDIDAVNNYDITPLQMALSYGRLLVIQTLVRMDADPDAEDRIGDTPAILVKQLGYPKDTLDHTAAEVGPLSETPIPLNLIHAVENNSLEEVEKTLSQGASPDTIVPLALHWPGNSTVLHRASHLGLVPIVKALLTAGGNVNARDKVGNTPLHTAVQDAHNEVAKVLLDGGAPRNACTQSGVTPLHRAAAKGHQSTMELLVKYGADLTLTDNQNRTPIDWAKQKGFMIVARNMKKFLN